MAMTIDDYNKKNAQMPKNNGKGDEVFLSEEDENALDKAWQQVREKQETAKQSTV